MQSFIGDVLKWLLFSHHSVVGLDAICCPEGKQIVVRVMSRKKAVAMLNPPRAVCYLVVMVEERRESPVPAPSVIFVISSSFVVLVVGPSLTCDVNIVVPVTTSIPRW